MALVAGLYHELHGPADAPVLLLSSGLGGSAGYWAPNLAALAARHRVIVYDHRGTGRSDRAVEGILTLESLADDMRLLLDGLGVERAAVIGHAVGGMAGMTMALATPERVDRLVVINGWARLDRHTARCFDTRLALLRASGPRAYLHAQPLFLYPPQWISDHHDQLLAEEEAQLTHFPGADMIERRIAAARRFDVVERLAQLRPATLFVSSDDDMLVPPAASARMHARLPGSQLAQLAEGGHACNVTRADHFNRWLLDWLDGE
ncbi:pyrimidine utilization protein D [Sphingomonas mollis]|uniref:Putative carbamate hydrolase RutD n=1 Tax=Sphingomonas mollis TaxID=2795726 RepID=A0ABS0XRY1_9SPHN|nr:pyrimidine utilization protein D [Sphingomonas sp. BT553]MBJ6122786.1 pyrimidine utilization protein D [Sphingomonas sp. BT553]